METEELNQEQIVKYMQSVQCCVEMVSEALKFNQKWINQTNLPQPDLQERVIGYGESQAEV